jgi:hypothetical protein
MDSSSRLSTSWTSIPDLIHHFRQAVRNQPICASVLMEMASTGPSDPAPPIATVRTPPAPRSLASDVYYGDKRIWGWHLRPLEFSARVRTLLRAGARGNCGSDLRLRPPDGRVVARTRRVSRLFRPRGTAFDDPLGRAVTAARDSVYYASDRPTRTDRQLGLIPSDPIPAYYWFRPRRPRPVGAAWMAVTAMVAE